AASAFFLVAGPAILEGVFDRIQRLQFEAGTVNWGNRNSYVWDGMRLLYFFGVVGTAIWVLRRRRKLTLIYNADPAAIAPGLMYVLDKLGLTWVRSDNTVFITSNAGSRGARTAAPLPATSPAQAVIFTGGEKGQSALALQEDGVPLADQPEQSPSGHLHSDMG